MYVYLGGPGGSFDPTRRLELPTGGSNTYVRADLDQDGHADLVCTARDRLRVFHGGPDGLRPDRFTDLRGRGQSIHSVQVGDFDRDGWLDLLAVAFTYDDNPTTMAASSVIFHGSAQGFSSERSTVLPTYTMGNARVADLTGNGWLDVICYHPRGYLCLYHGGPAGFSPQRMSRIPLDIGGTGNVAAINCADLTGNGYLDLIVVVMGHYTRMQSGFHILYGGHEGYSQERGEFHPTDASSILLTVADVNRDGHLDLLVPAYSTQYSRVLPAHIYWGTAGGTDFAHPTVIPCESSCAFQVVDMTGNGYRDVLAVCHRTDLGHRVDSLLFSNGPDGLDLEHPTRLPGMGPHLSTPRDLAMPSRGNRASAIAPRPTSWPAGSRCGWRGASARRRAPRWSCSSAGPTRARSWRERLGKAPPVRAAPSRLLEKWWGFAGRSAGCSIRRPSSPATAATPRRCAR